jgi:PEP-CTERM motif
MKKTSRRLWTPAVAALFAFIGTVSGQAEAAVILQQSPTLSGGGVTSDTAVIRSFEDFRLTAGAQITDLQWWGSVTNVPGIYEPLNGPISFTIAFYLDGPGGFVPAASAFSQQVVSATGAIVAPDFGVAHFAAHLTAPVDLPSNTDLWLSIVGHDLAGGHAFAVPFTWGSASGDAPNAPTPGLVASQFDGSDPFLQGTRLSFVLESNPIPEPATLTLLGAGLAAMALGRRRARGRA